MSADDPRLPPAAVDAVDVEEALIPAMGLRPDRSGAQALRTAIAGRDVLWAAPSGTRVDTGEWFSGRKAWLIALRDALLIFAAHPRSRRLHARIEDLPFTAITAAVYNHVTGELVLTTARDFTIFDHAAVRGSDRFGLRLAPVEAYQTISQIHSSVKVIHA